MAALAALHLRPVERPLAASAAAQRLSLAQQIEAKLIKRCLGTSPVYFRDAAGAPVAIIATLEKWKPDDMSAGVLGMKYGLTASSTPPWGHAAKVSAGDLSHE